MIRNLLFKSRCLIWDNVRQLHECPQVGSFEDLVSTSISYFRAKRQIKDDKIIKSVIHRLRVSLPSINPLEPGYCEVVKCIRYSARHASKESRQLVSDMLDDVIQKKIIFASTYNAMHTVKLMESFRIYNADVLDQVVKLIRGEAGKFRIKDLQYLLTSLSNFAYRDLILDGELRHVFDSLCYAVVSETRPDVNRQHLHLIPLLRSFAYFNYYNDDLINYLSNLLSTERMVSCLPGIFESDRSLLLLYSATRIEGCRTKLSDGGPSGRKLFKDLSSKMERHGSTGLVGPKSQLHRLSNLLNKSQEKLYPTTAIFRRMADSLANREEFQNDMNLSFQYTLPHQNFADLIVSTGLAPGPYDRETLLPAPLDEAHKFCLVYGLRQKDFVDGHNRLCGYKRFNMRLLSELGYSITTVDMDNIDIEETARKVTSALNHHDCLG